MSLWRLLIPVPDESLLPPTGTSAAQAQLGSSDHQHVFFLTTSSRQGAEATVPLTLFVGGMVFVCIFICFTYSTLKRRAARVALSPAHMPTFEVFPMQQLPNASSRNPRQGSGTLSQFFIITSPAAAATATTIEPTFEPPEQSGLHRRPDGQATSQQGFGTRPGFFIITSPGTAATAGTIGPSNAFIPVRATLQQPDRDSLHGQHNAQANLPPHSPRSIGNTAQLFAANSSPSVVVRRNSGASASAQEVFSSIFPIFPSIEHQPPPSSSSTSSSSSTRTRKRPTPPNKSVYVYIRDHPPESEKESVCMICLDPLDKGVIVAGVCKHWMHESCLRLWLAKSRKQECPTCRRTLTEPIPQDRGEEPGVGNKT